MKMVLLVRLHIISIVLLWGINSRAAAASADHELAPPPIAKPNCTAHCGGVSIPYPFGIGPNSDCYFDDWFQIDCHNSTTPILRRSKLEVLNVSLDYWYGSGIQVKYPITFFSCKGKEIRKSTNLTGSPFVYSQYRNMFVAVSCGFLVSVSSDDENVVGSCKSNCDPNSGLYNDNWACYSNINCCQLTIPPDLKVINSSIQAQAGESRMADCNDYAFLVDQEWFMNNRTNLSDVKKMDSVPVVLDWSLNLDNNKSLIKLFEGFSAEPTRNPNDPTPVCSFTNGTGTYNNRSTVTCSCPNGFEGNPYLLQTCQDIDECKVLEKCIPDYLLSQPSYYKDRWPNVWNISNPICENTLGGHTCYNNLTGATCEFFAANLTDTKCYMRERPSRSWWSKQMKPIFSGLGSGVGVLLLLIGAWWAHKALKKRKIIKRKELFFRRNGGLLLEQQISSGKVNIDKIKLFNSNELEKSTDNFNIDRVLGQGGQGTIFKGMLADGNIVAVKKSKIDDKGKVSEFINEVIILSQINHRNIVQLLGCCLETEVPLLVYEFVPNGTLSQYIYEQNEEFPLTWQMRLQIATEIAGALSYLHVAATFPIYHRDIKSTNILLDEKYRAKIADFGISRTVAIDQTHLTTNVHGTFGYMDPEYFQSSQFTEKSDVYSFGVVLVELLTGQKPISAVKRSTEGEEEKEEYRSLATYFIISMQEDRLFNILDSRVVNEGSKEDIMIVADLARRCLNFNGRNRPTMREVTAELEAIQMSNKTHQGAEIITEVHYPIDLCDDVVSSSTGSTWDSGPAGFIIT
ncbi:hypothetical protein M0R45_025300 [Rubus argutus]|uniref:Protein kinase domain-containing protein n=1 Tax=Rubus argutus TaxID=59490 RepID=A0AAW1WWJ4_RUBAR